MSRIEGDQQLLEIQRIYDEDQEKGRIATVETDIPVSYEAISPKWLTAVLCRAAPGAEVVDFRLGAVDNGTTNRRRIHLTYNAEGRKRNLPASVFCKATQDLNSRIASCGMGDTELVFYTQLRPQIDIEAPTAIFANIDRESFNSILILNDIGDVATFCTHETDIDHDRARQMVRLLASLHGTFYEDPLLTAPGVALRPWPEFWAFMRRLGNDEASNRGFLDAKEVIPPRLYSRYDEVYPATQRSVDSHLSLPKTFNHGDPHLRNWYVTDAGRMGLTDWGGACVGHWSRDLAYALSVALKTEDRRAWERDLIDYYLDELESFGVPRIPFELAWDYYRQQLFSSLAYWTVTLRPMPDYPALMQPVAPTMEFIGRIARAIDDLDAFDGFRA